MARITIPYAVTDFADLRERGFYYVDKTNIMLIRQIIFRDLKTTMLLFFSVPAVSGKVCSSPAGSLLRPYKGESF